MSSFAYVALEPSGKRRSGHVEAADRDAAIALLASEGRYVVDIKEEAAVQQSAIATVRGKASRSDLALFTRRLADLSGAGLPLDRVLQVISEQSESPQLSTISLEALEDVRGGLPVSSALAKHPRLFQPVYTETLRAGEASGQFPQVASRLADFQEREVERRSQVVSAMIYPAVLTFTAVAVIGFLFGFVLPKLSGVFKDLGSNLPTSTKILLATTDFLSQNVLLIGGVLVGSILGYRGWIATEAGALQRDTLLLKLPSAGKVIAKAVVSRFARVLGTLLYGGVPILESLRLAGLASGNKAMVRASESVADDVRDGRAINQAMKDAGSFPPVLTHMVAIGEETGDLPTMLGRVADSLDFEVDTGMRRLTAMFEPVIVVVMGTIVGFVVLSVLLPIFQAQSLIK
ncbi:MAG: type II secretion system F family protein [Armatimonadetes bacterium]|nr:type II secretion system F family protein [Armatimonadota bacterium]